MKTCPKCDHVNEDAVSFCEECGIMLPAGDNEPDPIIGSLLVDKFRIGELIGQGAMGKVYRATQEPINRQVAVKILHQHLMEDKRVARRFQREAEAASRFSHPNSIGIFDFGQTKEGALYIAMEYIVGTDLADVISRQAPIDPERTVRVATQVLSALHLAHASKIIHRDLKPENIMLSDLPGHKDFVKVCDFGIAKIQQQPGTNGQESALTMFGMICGTPYYMSPEQAKGEELDGRTDLYSMGIILYEMLTGEVPFRGSTPVEVIARHLTDPPLPPSKLRPDLRIPRALEEVVLRALSKKREERFNDAQHFTEALEKALKEAEFEADLKRVLQEAQSEPAQSHTPDKEFVASQVAQPQTVMDGPTAFHPASLGQQAAMGAPIASPKGPPIASPQMPLSTRSSGPLTPVATTRPSTQGISRNTPVPSLRSAPIQQHPPLILSDSIDDDDDFDPQPGGKGKIFVILVLLIGVACVGYYLYERNRRFNEGTTKKPIKLVGKVPGWDKKKRKIPPLKRVAKRSAVIPTRRRTVRRPIRKRRRRRVARVSKRNNAQQRRFKAKLQAFIGWKRKYGFYFGDLNPRIKQLYDRANKSAKNKNYDQAQNYLNDLKEQIGSYKKVPVKLIDKKYTRLNQKYTRIKGKMRPHHRKLVDKYFQQAVLAQMSNNFRKVNSLSTKARRIIDKYR